MPRPVSDPMPAAARLESFAPPVRVLIDAHAKQAAAYRRTPWRGLNTLRGQLRRLRTDEMTIDQATCELARRVGLVPEIVDRRDACP